MELKQVFDKCLHKIGGKANKDVHWYLEERPKVITRESFFRDAVWVIWVTGLTRKGTETFLERAEQNGFNYDFCIVASWDDQAFRQFVEKLHGQPVPERTYKKWEAVREIAKKVNDFSTEADFRRRFFGGKVQSSTLDKEDIQRILAQGFPFIGEANANYIVRNMGGEAIKCDRWIERFLQYYKISLDELEKQIQELKIPLGLFDVVLWAYCEEHVKKVEKFEEHFSKHFDQPFA